MPMHGNKLEEPLVAAAELAQASPVNLPGQERLPLYLEFFEYVHNVRRRGKALPGSLIGLLLAPRIPDESPRSARFVNSAQEDCKVSPSPTGLDRKSVV